MKLFEITNEFFSWSNGNDIVPEQIIIQVANDADIFQAQSQVRHEFDPMLSGLPQPDALFEPHFMAGQLQFKFQLFGIEMKFISKQRHYGPVRYATIDQSLRSRLDK